MLDQVIKSVLGAGDEAQLVGAGDERVRDVHALVAIAASLIEFLRVLSLQPCKGIDDLVRGKYVYFKIYYVKPVPAAGPWPARARALGPWARPPKPPNFDSAPSRAGEWSWKACPFMI